MKPMLVERDYIEAARELDVDVPTIKAVVTVESNGSGFYFDGTPKVLFERHVMYKKVKEKLGAAAAEKYYSMYPELCNPKAGGYGPSDDQPIRMGMASTLINRNCALESASWGLFQIMGYHWKSIGYLTLQAFVNAMYASEGSQLQAFIAFIQENNLEEPLRKHDWATFARRYNGPDYAKNKYDTKLASAYARHGGVL